MTGAGAKYRVINFLIVFIHISLVRSNIFDFPWGGVFQRKKLKLSPKYLYSRSNDTGIRIKLPFPKSQAPCHDLHTLLTLTTRHRGNYQTHFSHEKTEAQNDFAVA